MSTIGNMPAGHKATECRYCGAAFHELSTGYGVCDRCDTRNTFSDTYKSLHGHRPSLEWWTLASMRAWLATEYSGCERDAASL